MEKPTSAEMAAREEAWRAAAAKWLIDIQKPLRDREQFQVGEIAEALARQHGRLEVDDRERRRIVIDLFEWMTRGECHETDVMMLVGRPHLCEPFLPALRAEREAAEQERRELWGNPDFGANRPALEQRHGGVRINMEALVLRRTAVRRYLETCALGGAPRVLREWFGVDEVAIPEAAKLKTGAPSKGRRGRPGPKPERRTAIANKMLDDLRSERRTPEALRRDKLAALAKQYGGSPNTAKVAREDALARFVKVSEFNIETNSEKL